MSEKILVIKLSALGDFVQTLGIMAAIRKHHPNAHITLLTTKPFKAFAEKCGYFDEIFIDKRPKFFNILEIYNFRKKLIKANFTLIYDLQNNNRTSLYSKFFSTKIKWIGTKKGVFGQNKQKQKIHAFEKRKQMLEHEGIKDIKIDRLEWMKEDVSSFDIKTPYIMLVAGCAPQHPQKRWDMEKYGDLACKLTDMGYQIILLGTDAEKDVTDTIFEICPKALNLTGKTSLFQIATLAHGAAAAVGNDTGPMHIIAPTGCATIALFSSSSNPICHAPMGENVSTLQKDNLDDLDVSEVLAKIKQP